jgi:ribosomal protein S6
MSNTEDHKEAQVYELGYLVLPSIPEESLADVVSTLQGIVKKSGGVEIASEDPIKFDLAYEMSKVVGARKYVANEAFIGWMKFEVEPSEVVSIKTAVEALDEILRCLLIKAPRESVFTFAAAQKAIEEAEKAAAMPAEESAAAPVEPVLE